MPLTRSVLVGLVAAGLMAASAWAGQKIERVAYLLGPVPEDAAATAAVLEGRLDAAGRHPSVSVTGAGLRVEIDRDPEDPKLGALMTVPGVFAIHREVRPVERCPAEQPPGMACLPDRDEGRGAYVLLVEPALVGDVLAEVGMSVDPGGYPALTIRFRADAARRFGELTTRALGQPLAIVIDGEVIIAPVVREPILGGSAVLTGTEEDIALWAAMLGRPPLPVRLEVLAVEAAEPVVRGRRRR